MAQYLDMSAIINIETASLAGDKKEDTEEEEKK